MSIVPPRICDLGTVRDLRHSTFRRVCTLGFSHLLWDADADGFAAIAAEASRVKLGLIARLALAEFALDHPLVLAHPRLFAVRHQRGRGAVDPRQSEAQSGNAHIRDFDSPVVLGFWQTLLDAYLASGARGFLISKAQAIPAKHRCRLFAHARARVPEIIFIAEPQDFCETQLASLRDSMFDYCIFPIPQKSHSGLRLVENRQALAHIAPVLSYVDLEEPTVSPCRALTLATLCGNGVVIKLAATNDNAFEPASAGRDLDPTIRAINDFIATDEIITAPGTLQRMATGSAGVILRPQDADLRSSKLALLALEDGQATHAREPNGEQIQSVLGDWQICPTQHSRDVLEARGGRSDWQLLRAQRRKPISRPAPASLSALSLATQQPRIVIDNISPAVDGGRFPLKRIVGDTLQVEADIFTDGHPMIAADLLCRPADEKTWTRTRMRQLANDRWSGKMPLHRIGPHFFLIEAWIDSYGGLVRDMTRKWEAGREIAPDLAEALTMIAATPPVDNPISRVALDAVVSPQAPETLAMLSAPETTERMYQHGPRTFVAQSPAQSVETDRAGARFASWYELFPRSQTNDPARHGTLRDVIARLPSIQDMGFDVLYLPPIHPIGKNNRKGRNNALRAAPQDLGSVYAIGSEEGDHKTIHPQLGTLEDFHFLVEQTRAHGMEIALDFAVQASPDHPWLREHPDWFNWRADGSIKYAENPPKLYEDIVNVDFYAAGAIPALWIELRDIVLFWADQGVRIFRVDNPHTKPLPFWQWLIGDVRSTNPDVLFLAEAFTRPKIMYQLAKLGFSQSYTYFTWRNSKSELTDYMRELTAEPVCDFFRPHFFTNTPDINPTFLQEGGRAGFLIRAALAATLSGLWGIYSGFELCEAAALPGREEYLDSEKYAVKPRNWNAPGNIIAEITQLNALRKREPALQTHLGLTFYNAFNPNILYYGKHAPGDENRLLIAVSLNSKQPEDGDIEIPLWEWGLPDDAALMVEDLLRGPRFVWHGKIQRISLPPEQPYRIWRLSPLSQANT